MNREQESTYEMLQDFLDTADEEIHAFCTMVAGLKDECRACTQKPHNGLVNISPRSQHVPYSDMTVKLVVYTSYSAEPVTFPATVSSSGGRVLLEPKTRQATGMGDKLPTPRSGLAKTRPISHCVYVYEKYSSIFTGLIMN